jgi:hypothetical protein
VAEAVAAAAAGRPPTGLRWTSGGGGGGSSGCTTWLSGAGIRWRVVTEWTENAERASLYRALHCGCPSAAALLPPVLRRMTAPPPPQPCACRCCSRPTVPSRSRVARSSLASSNSGVVASAAAVEVKPQQHSIQHCWLCCISAPGRQAHQTRPEKLRTKDVAAAGRNLLRSKRSRRLTIDDGALFRSWVVIRRFFSTNLCGPAVGPRFVNRAQTRPSRSSLARRNRPCSPWTGRSRCTPGLRRRTRSWCPTG